MTDVTFTQNSSAIRRAPIRVHPRECRGPWHEIGPSPWHLAQFKTISQVIELHGGFVNGEEVAARLQLLTDQPLSLLARRLVNRSVLSISWFDQLLIPSFQFDQADMSVRTCCARVFRELHDVFDNWELVLWFATPSVWLGNTTPVERIDVDSDAVLQAARTDRFIARG
jgi:hypothetical protein